MRHGLRSSFQWQRQPEASCNYRDYTDFYSSGACHERWHHVQRQNNPLLPNWLHLPVGYHGRASSVVVSGTQVAGPVGRSCPRMLRNRSFLPVKGWILSLKWHFLQAAWKQTWQAHKGFRSEEHIFGVVLMNDWSAGYSEVGIPAARPFVGKSFATTISPAGCSHGSTRAFAKEGVTQKPEPLEYLRIASVSGIIWQQSWKSCLKLRLLRKGRLSAVPTVAICIGVCLSSLPIIR